MGKKDDSTAAQTSPKGNWMMTDSSLVRLFFKRAMSGVLILS